MANAFSNLFKQLAARLEKDENKLNTSNEKKVSKQPEINGIPFNIINSINNAINSSFSDVDIEDSDRLYRYSQYIM